jgi:predicted dehydrogenase
MTYHQQRLVGKYGYDAVPLFQAAEFDRMIRETRPDVVIVCTPDATHDQFIVRALELGCDVITEKPMTTDETKCAAIFKAIEKSGGRKVRVAFNYRWGSGASRVFEVLRSNVIGKVINVHFEYMLNTFHGADYFRRWHSTKAMSGGLLVHKSTHHFDLVNWWIDAIPEEVFAYGRLAFYGYENAVTRGDSAFTPYPRYTGFDVRHDPFALTLEQGELKSIYHDAEKETGYLRDENVFRKGISIEDSMSVLVKYRTGATMTYTLSAFCPNEGYRVTFNGDRGRLEYEEQHEPHIITGQSDLELAAQQRAPQMSPPTLRVLPHFKTPYAIDIPLTEGAHGGGDPLLQAQMFGAQGLPDPLGRDAGHEQGAASILVGVAANHSIARGLPVRIDELFELAPQQSRLSSLRE